VPIFYVGHALMLCNMLLFILFRPSKLPWLYYLGDTTNNILTDTSITTEYTFPNSQLDLLASAFSLNGTFLGYQSVRGGLLQLCKNSESFMNAAFVFGTTYKQEVNFTCLRLS
jgi:meckelin